MSYKNIVLTYFNVAARAESARLTFYIGGIDFEDVRLSNEEFGKRKAAGEFTFGHLPVLDVDGERFAESTAILRFAGKLAGLYPFDLFAAAKVDMLISATEDITNAIGLTIREKDQEKKKLLARNKLAEETIPTFFNQLSNLIEKNKLLYQNSNFLVGNSISIADLQLFGLEKWINSGVLDNIPTSVLHNNENIRNHFNSILNHPKVSEYYSKHK